MRMEIEIAALMIVGAAVSRTDTYFIASVTLEGFLGVVKFEVVLGVAEM